MCSFYWGALSVHSESACAGELQTSYSIGSEQNKKIMVGAPFPYGSMHLLSSF